MTYYCNVLNEISSDVSHYVVEVVVMHIAAWFPEADISVSSRVLGIGLECANFSVGKLREKPWVFRPEQPDVGDGIENHSNALKPKAKGPTHFICDTCVPNGLNMSSRVAGSVVTYLRDPELIVKPRHSLGSRAICRGREPRLRNWGL
jgi:hypothetical protein